MARTKQTARKEVCFPPRASLFAATTSSSNDGHLEPLEAPAPLTDEMVKIIEEENRLRRLFISNRIDPELDNLHLNLTNVFDAPSSSFTFSSETEEERRIPKILTKCRRGKDLDGKGSVVNREEFMKRWNDFTNGVLKDLDWTNTFAAGGGVLACLSNAGGNSGTNSGFSASDIDLFVYGISSESQANEKLRQINEIISRNVRNITEKEGKPKSEQPLVVRTNRAITFICEFPIRSIQVVLRLYKSPAEVLLGFDVDCCCVGFDGKDVWCTERFRKALNLSLNIVNPTRRSFNYETRLYKYSRRGYAVAVPDLDKSKVSVSLFENPPPDPEINQGLGKLLRYEYEDLHSSEQEPNVTYSKSLHRMLKMARNLNAGRTNSRKIRRNQTFSSASQIEGGEDFAQKVFEYASLEASHPSDYSEIFLPWGPRWNLNTIKNVLEFRDKAQFFAKWKEEISKIPKSERKKQESQTKSSRKPPVHNHTFVMGIESAISGEVNSENCWCTMCRNHEPLIGDNGMKLVSGPLKWEQERPCCQDFEDGQVRMMTGSFSISSVTKPFDYLVYNTKTEQTTTTNPHPLQRNSEQKQSHINPFSTFSNAPSSTNDNFPCSICGMMLPSQNALDGHKNTIHLKPPQQSTPFGIVGSGPFGPTPPHPHPQSRLFGTQIQTPTFPCLICGMMLPSQNALDEHKKLAHQQTITIPTTNLDELTQSLMENIHNIQSRSAMALLLIAGLFRSSMIGVLAKSALKDLVVSGEKSEGGALVLAAVDVFLADGDLDDLSDTFNRIAKKYSSH